MRVKLGVFDVNWTLLLQSVTKELIQVKPIVSLAKKIRFRPA